MDKKTLKKTTTMKTLVKILACFWGILFGLSQLYVGNCITAICFLIIAAIAFGTLKKRIWSKYRILQKANLVIAVCVALTLIALSKVSPNPKETNSISDNQMEPVLVDYDKILSTYIISSPELPVIKNMHDIVEWESIFHQNGNSNINLLSVDKNDYAIKLLRHDTALVLYHPSFSHKDQISTSEYINDIGEKGSLVDYHVQFKIVNDKVSEVSPVLICKNAEDKRDTVLANREFSLKKYEKVKEVSRQRAKINDYRELIHSQGIARERIAEVDRLKAQFKKDCLHADNACLDLIVYVKRQLYDPGSFQHVYTTYQIVDDYAVLVMQYRAKNALGALVLESVKAKITFNCRIISVGHMR